MDRKKVVAACSVAAAAVTIWAVCRVRASSGAKKPKSQTPSVTVLSPAAVPSLQTPPTNHLEEKSASKKLSLKERKSVVPLDLTAETSVESIDCETLASWLTKGEKPVLVDVRSDDFKGGHVAGSKHLPFTENRGGYLKALSPEPGQKIVFVCMYGEEQSPSAAQSFSQSCDASAMPEVHVLHGGFQAWLRYCARADLSTYIADYNPDFWVSQDGGLVYRSDLEEAPPGLLRAPSLRHMRMQSSTLRLNLDENLRYEWLDFNTLNSWLELEKADRPVIVDVRAEDYKGGHITGSMNIPYGSFSVRLKEVEAALRDHKGQMANTVVFVCMHGEEWSPNCAMKFLIASSDPAVKVYVLRKGFQDWLNCCLCFCPMTVKVDEYDPEVWVKQDKFYVYQNELAGGFS